VPQGLCICKTAPSTANAKTTGIGHPQLEMHVDRAADATMLPDGMDTSQHWYR
jgi:hypothetical protein